MKSPPEISLDDGDDSVDGDNIDNIDNIDDIDNSDLPVGRGGEDKEQAAHPKTWKQKN